MVKREEEVLDFVLELITQDKEDLVYKNSENMVLSKEDEELVKDFVSRYRGVNKTEDDVNTYITVSELLKGIVVKGSKDEEIRDGFVYIEDTKENKHYIKIPSLAVMLTLFMTLEAKTEEVVNNLGYKVHGIGIYKSGDDYDTVVYDGDGTINTLVSLF